ncbi:MAG: SUF system Fe-S cluster assembly regulator [Acidobacteriota bacterium]|nr:SUF system Fe-S cluster assembly regulator [Acidobacteriota bacterium]
MIRLTKLADYGVVLMSHMAAEPDHLHTAAGLAREAWVSTATAAKILKVLARDGLLDSHRGANGGYALAREASRITVADIISAMEGPIAVTECVDDSPVECSVQSVCQVRGGWQKINDAVRRALEEITLVDMAETIHSNEANPPENLIHIRRGAQPDRA